jgi:hypothetical protein
MVSLSVLLSSHSKLLVQSGALLGNSISDGDLDAYRLNM